jgi:hypothetical protein
LSQSILYSGETNTKVLTENKFLRLSEVDYKYWSDESKMYGLELKVGEKIVHIRRFDKLERKYDYNHDPLSRLMLECLDQDKGFYSVYSDKLKPNEVHDDQYGYGNPLDEIDSRVMYGKPDQLRKGFITFGKMKNGIYQFIGNHENYSGAFMYYIWNESIIKKIKEHLTKNPDVFFKSEENK